MAQDPWPAGPARLAAMIAGDTPARSFAPIEPARAHTLVLGTMPGTASLGAREYYAHPRNAFWPIMLAVAGILPLDRRAWLGVSYAERTSRLADAGFAVWDVLAECERPGSLDGAIVRASERANDIAALVARHDGLGRIAFNGRKARQLFDRHVAIPEEASGGPVRLDCPSTSPAMASLSLEAKHAAWAEALGR